MNAARPGRRRLLNERRALTAGAELGGGAGPLLRPDVVDVPEHHPTPVAAGDQVRPPPPAAARSQPPGPCPSSLPSSSLGMEISSQWWPSPAGTRNMYFVRCCATGGTSSNEGSPSCPKELSLLIWNCPISIGFEACAV